MLETIVIAGLGAVAITSTAINFLGVPGISAAGIASALAVIGSVVGMGMFAGVVTIAVCGVVIGTLISGVFVSRFGF